MGNIVAIVGRPNVGKSTLFNRLTGTRQAIVNEEAGTTRDRQYGKVEWTGKEFSLIDTGGWVVNSEDIFEEEINKQVKIAIEEADVILFVVDVESGINDLDMEVADILRRCKRPVIVVANKADNYAMHAASAEFYSFGLGDPVCISAINGSYTGDLLDKIITVLPADKEEEREEELPRIAVIGRPNAGKSSLTNRLTNTDRSIVSDVAGTTRDAIDTVVVHDGKKYRIVDTAGLRRKSQIDEDVEYYGFVRAMRAIDRADVALLVIDGSIGLTDQDQRVAGFAAERGCAMIIVLNKWDLVEGPEAKAEVRERIEDRMTFVGYAPVVATCALTGKKVDRIWDAVDKAYAGFSQTISTNKLNSWLSSIRETGHTVSQGKAVLRMKYVTQTGTCPPHFTVFVNRPDLVTDNYERFLENRLRKTFDLEGTPIRLKFKKKD